MAKRNTEIDTITLILVPTAEADTETQKLTANGIDMARALGRKWCRERIKPLVITAETRPAIETAIEACSHNGQHPLPLVGEEICASTALHLGTGEDLSSAIRDAYERLKAHVGEKPVLLQDILDSREDAHLFLRYQQEASKIIKRICAVSTDRIETIILIGSQPWLQLVAASFYSVVKDARLLTLQIRVGKTFELLAPRRFFKN